MRSLRRPLAVAGFSSLATVLCSIFFDCTALVVFEVAFAALVIIVSMIFRFKSSSTFIVSGVSVMLAGIFLLVAEYHHDKTVSLCSENAFVEAVITEKPKFSQDVVRYYAVASLKNIDGEKAYGKIRLSFSQTKDEIDPDNIEIGDKITFNAYIYKIGINSDDVHNYFKSENIFVGAYFIKNLNIEKPGIRPLTYFSSEIKDKMIKILDSSFSDSVSGLIKAVLTGDKSSCPDWIWLNFKRAGATHILAVSGLHLTIWFMLVLRLFNSITFMRKLKYIIAIPIVVFFLLIADFSFSATRATLMILLFIIGGLIGKSSDSLNSIGFALVVILLFNPYSVYSISFQLSFSCVFAITVFANPLYEKIDFNLSKKLSNNKLKSFVSGVAESIIISLSVGIFTFPICAYHFRYVSLIYPVTNLILVPLCGPLLIFSVVFILFSKTPYISDLLKFITDLIAKFFIYVTDFLSDFELSAISIDEEEISAWLLIVALVLLAYFLYRKGQQYYFKIICITLSFITAFSLVGIINNKYDICKIKVIKNDSDVVCLVTLGGKAVLLGTSDDYYFNSELNFALESENSQLVAIVPEIGCDKKQLEYLCADFDVKNIINTNENIVLYDKFFINNNGNNVIINFNGKSIGVLFNENLQEGLLCDIIISKDFIISYEKQYKFDEKTGHILTLYIGLNNVRIRRNIFA